VLAVLKTLREQARNALPDEVWRWLQATADAGATADSDTDAAAWERLALRPHVLRDVSGADPSVTLLGRRFASPVLAAPIGYQRFVHSDGETATARAVAGHGVPFIVSTRSATRFEDVGAICPDWWMQVYVLRDRGLTAELVGRAVAAGAAALVLTGDTPYLGSQKETGRSLDTRSVHRTNLGDREVADGATEQDPTIGLDAIGWLHDISGLPVLVKGVVRGDDAVDCVAAGAAGVVVSNHGRRQAARVVNTAVALPEVVARVAGSVDVLVDGGIRDGTGVLAALALGARAVLVGRPVMWGLAARGSDGVTAVLAALHDDFVRQLGLVGARTVGRLSPDLISRFGPTPDR
jgi:4-hydroxymandelate oxidase